MSGTKIPVLSVEETKREAMADPRVAFGGARELCSYGRHRSNFVSPAEPATFMSPKIPVDLAIGSETVLDEDLLESVASLKAGFGDFLKAIVNNALSFEGINFLSFRNNITKVLATPYERNEWEIDVASLHGVICLGIVKLESNLRFESKYHRDTVYWGYRFEDICTGVSPSAPFEDPATKDKYYTINRVKLGKYSLLIGAEIDSVEKDVTGAQRYVEIKTSKQINEKTDYSFRRGKLFSCYLQSKIVDVPKIVMGFRDDRGIVREIKEYDVDSLPKEGRDWDPSVCISFTTRVLHFLRLHVRSGLNYRLTNRDGRITLSNLSDEASFMPASFADYIASHKHVLSSKLSLLVLIPTDLSLSTPSKPSAIPAPAPHARSPPRSSSSSSRPHSEPRASSSDTSHPRRSDGPADKSRPSDRHYSSHSHHPASDRSSSHAHPSTSDRYSNHSRPSSADRNSSLSHPSASDHRRNPSQDRDSDYRGVKRLREDHSDSLRTTRPPAELECHFGRACRRRECPFIHPHGREMDETAVPGSAPRTAMYSGPPLLVNAPDLLTDFGPPPFLTDPTPTPQIPNRAQSPPREGSVTPAYPSLVRKRFRD